LLNKVHSTKPAVEGRLKPQQHKSLKGSQWFKTVSPTDIVFLSLNSIEASQKVSWQKEISSQNLALLEFPHFLLSRTGLDSKSLP